MCTFVSVRKAFLYSSCSFLLFVGTMALTTPTLAGGSIFGGGKHKTSNLAGVYAINVHICNSQECPPVRIIPGQCDGEHMTKHWGVCVCDEGYVAKNGSCALCPAGEFSDGINDCQPCPEGTFKSEPGESECIPCPTEAIQCSVSGFTCPAYLQKTATGCQCPNAGTVNATQTACCQDNKTWNDTTQSYSNYDPCTCSGEDSQACCATKSGKAWIKGACQNCPQDEASICINGELFCTEGAIKEDDQCIWCEHSWKGECFDNDLSSYCMITQYPSIWDGNQCQQCGYVSGGGECCLDYSQSDGCCQVIGGTWEDDQCIIPY